MAAFLSSISEVKIPSTSLTTFAHLPQLVTNKIFDYLPLSSVIHSDEVCREWSQLKNSALKRRTRLVLCHKREDIKVFTMPHLFKDSIKESSNKNTTLVELYFAEDPLVRDLFVYGDYLDQPCTDKIISLMPNLIEIQLTGDFKSQTTFNGAIDLISAYNNTLKILKLIFENQLFQWQHFCLFEKFILKSSNGNVNFRKYNPVDSDVVGFFRAFLFKLRNISVLKQLSLKINFSALTDYDYAKFFLKQLTLPVKQIKKLNICIDCKKHDSFRNLSGLEKSELFTNLILDAEKNTNLKTFCIQTKLCLSTLSSFGPYVKKQIKTVYISDTLHVNNIEKLKSFALQFSNLKTLTVCVIGMFELKNVLKTLVFCEKLELLSIGTSEDVSNNHPINTNTQLNDNILKVPVLPSVKYLW